MTVLEERVISYLRDNREDLFRAVSELVQIDTQNFKTHGNENAGQAYFEKRCREIGLAVDRYTLASVAGLTEHPEFQAGRDAEHRENAVAVFAGEQDENAIMLAGHMDTMPFGDLAAWELPPLSGAVKDGYIYGRGSGDDKYGVMMPWFVLKAFKELGITPKKNILIGSYADEEYGGCNGPIALCMKYPCGAYVNIDGATLETEACGGACYAIEVTSHNVTAGVASVFDVYDGVAMVMEALKSLDARSGTKVRLSSFAGGTMGEKAAIVKFAIYTNMSKDETAAELHRLYEAMQPKLKAENLSCTEFERRTRFFAYGKTMPDSREAALFAEAIREIKGTYTEVAGHDLTDLSDFMANGTLNSMNYGMPYGTAEAHQPNENIACSELLACAEALALVLLRGYVE